MIFHQQSWVAVVCCMDTPLAGTTGITQTTSKLQVIPFQRTQFEFVKRRFVAHTNFCRGNFGARWLDAIFGTIDKNWIEKYTQQSWISHRPRQLSPCQLRNHLMPYFINRNYIILCSMRVYFNSACHPLKGHAVYLEICTFMSSSDGTNLRSKRYWPSSNNSGNLFACNTAMDCHLERAPPTAKSSISNTFCEAIVIKTRQESFAFCTCRLLLSADDTSLYLRLILQRYHL